MKIETKPSATRDASAVVLLDRNSPPVVCWARRNPQLLFLGGWHAFPGGKVEAADALIRVKNCEEKDLEKFIVAAARECFEEVGVLLVRNGEKLTKGQRASLHDDLTSGRFSFLEILENWNLHIDALDFSYAGFWTTPPVSPVRFKTRFFVAVCPAKQTPYAAISEMQNVEFVEPKNALRRWENAEVFISPPVLIALKELADAPENANQTREIVSRNLLEQSKSCGGAIDYVELNSRAICFPVKTKTLPPATHTNCFIVGGREFVVVDAAARERGEQAKLFDFIDRLVERGGVCRAIIVSHLHRDHTGGESALKKRLFEKYNMRAPVAAHRLTAENARGFEIKDVDEFLEDETIFNLRGWDEKPFDLRVLHTPGHARGHLAFYDEAFGFLLASDNVSGGADGVLIRAPEGDMIDYLASLKRLKNLPNLRFLCGSHGAAVFDARGKIEAYLAHRTERERKIVETIEAGAKSVAEIVEKVYADLSLELRVSARQSVEAHLVKLRAEKVTDFR